MTRDERAELQLLADFVRDWREEDRGWKRDMDARMRSVEGFVTGALAERRAASRARLSRRQAAGVVVAAAGVLVSLVLDLMSL